MINKLQNLDVLPKLWTLLILVGACALATVLVSQFGSRAMGQTLLEASIRMMIVISLFLFCGNSGIISFCHMTFAMIGAYVTAWQTCCLATRSMFFPGLPDWLLGYDGGFLVAMFSAGLVAAIVGLLIGLVLMRLNGAAAEISSFAFLVVIYVIYQRWNSITAGSLSVTGIPLNTTPWSALSFVTLSLVIAFGYSQSRFGLALRASREDEVAAKASGVNVYAQRLIAFVLSAFIAGMAGGLYAQFLGLLSVDMFYLSATLIVLAMLIVGGMRSLSGAVVGVGAVSIFIEVMRKLEAGFPLGGSHYALPKSSAEVGVGLFLLVILIFRPSGITKGLEVGEFIKGNRSRSPADVELNRDVPASTIAERL